MVKKSKKIKLLVANGVNLDLLGNREPDLYGFDTLSDIHELLLDQVDLWQKNINFPQCEIDFFQTNHEGVFLEKLDDGFDGAVLNPGAWTHTSLALADRLKALKMPFVEVHISNLSAREEFRKNSFSAPFSLGVCYGFGVDSYVAGLYCLIRFLMKNPSM